jgi:kynurenine formamidase
VKRRQLFRTAAAGVAGIVGAQALGATSPAGAAAGRGPGHGHGGGPRPDRSVLGSLGLVYLSHVNDPATTPIFHGDPEFTLTPVTTVPVDGYYMQYVQQGEHTGTHWGAPAHFQEDGLTADQLAPEDLFLPAVKVDIRAEAAADADYALTVDDLKAWERRNGRIPDGAAVIAWTGWEDKWGTPAYPNHDDDGVVHQPGFSVEAVEWLIETGRLGERGALGTDTFGPDRGVDDTYAVSTLLYDRRRITLENLANLANLPTKRARVLVGGPINRAGSGSTATIYGVLPPGA